jgi:hypothetical protein
VIPGVHRRKLESFVLQNLGSTALAVDVPRGPALTVLRESRSFRRGSAKGEVRRATRPLNLGGTALSVDVP